MSCGIVVCYSFEICSAQIHSLNSITWSRPTRGKRTRIRSNSFETRCTRPCRSTQRDSLPIRAASRRRWSHRRRIGIGLWPGPVGTNRITDSRVIRRSTTFETAQRQLLPIPIPHSLADRQSLTDPQTQLKLPSLARRSPKQGFRLVDGGTAHGLSCTMFQWIGLWSTRRMACVPG